MIDTLNLCLYLNEATRSTAFAEISKCFDNKPTIISYPDGSSNIYGNIGSLKVSVSPVAVKIKDSSFAKWLLGSNLKTLTRKDIETGINKLSAMFHLPMDEAIVQRLDIGCNLIMKKPIETYLRQLGNLPWFSRLEQPHGLYYNGANNQLAFYDKIREQKRDGCKIPELYRGLNVLRYEVRLLHRIKDLLKVPEVTAKQLYNEKFYISLWLYWREYYYKIQKNKDALLNFRVMATVSEQNRIALINWVIQNGGQAKYIQQISEAYKRGEISKEQSFRLRQAVKKAFEPENDKASIIKQNENIEELNKKIDEATQFFR